MNKKRIAIIIAAALFPLAGILFLVLFLELHINSYSKDRIYESLDDTPSFQVGLIPGTSKFTVHGTRNMYYQNRLDAAADLFNNGNIKKIIVSGDTRDPFYNEPSRMKQDLIEMGIPSENIVRDDDGFRTLFSVLHSRHLTENDSILFISQKFHNQRALYLANAYDIEMWAFNASDVSKRGGFRTQVRERFARIKAFTDVHFFRPEPILPD